MPEHAHFEVKPDDQGNPFTATVIDDDFLPSEEFQSGTIRIEPRAMIGETLLKNAGDEEGHILGFLAMGETEETAATLIDFYQNLDEGYYGTKSGRERIEDATKYLLKVLGGLARAELIFEP